MLLTLLATTAALAASPLDLAVDIAEPGLQAWWRAGELVVGAPERGDRTALRPLVDLRPTTLPADLEGWTELGSCSEAPVKGSLEHGGQVITATVAGSPEQRAVFLRVGDELRAQQALGRPIVPCSVHVGQADGAPGLEVLISWHFGEGPAKLQGLTVFRIAESALAPAAATPPP